MSAPSQILVFDRALLRRRRDRTAAGFAAHSALVDESAAELKDRLSDVARRFTSVLDLGGQNNSLIQQFRQEDIFTVTADISEKRIRESKGPAILADEEILPFAAQSFDLVISNLSLHWVNDLPGALVQIKRTLRPDGLFLAALLGGQTLHELRACLLDAELAVTGGVSPRLSPVVDLLTASSLMQRAGFTLPVTDAETITFTYSDAFALMRDLRGMGETNTHLHRLRYPTRRAVFTEAARLYQQRYGMPDGQIPATFEVIFLHGWA